MGEVTDTITRSRRETAARVGDVVPAVGTRHVFRVALTSQLYCSRSGKHTRSAPIDATV